MPIMEVQYRAGDLDPATKADLAERLTQIMIRMEGGGDTFGGRAFAWVLFRELSTDDWWAGGETAETYVYPPGRFLVHVTIPEGYMNAEHKNEVHDWVAAAILKAKGVSGENADKSPASSKSAGKSILTVIDEVTEGNWGWAGLPLGMAKIAPAVGLAKTSERFAWTTAYFTAKARERISAGYPADAGGIMAGIEGSTATAQANAAGQSRTAAPAKS
ncbi:4-oxalocrotonate tautomerase [Mesorhizobium sp. BR1-1-16]|uniref:tautomerase family protein n=1 Tax=Mesorhizobium sp. BR1-1-16 TaxID=2876653 RepID=UPI001CC9A5CB|nr:4-oxalocrotonate tautomerase [Mesorhizobium sp. BR1-1-16]MBZ9939223.1 4-oxalocrotonate tautomerase [Mesorhizobium sp. BR1-1-16]